MLSGDEVDNHVQVGKVMVKGLSGQVKPHLVVFAAEDFHMTSQAKGARLQEGEDLEHGPVPVRDLLGHDLVQHGHRQAQQCQRLPPGLLVRVEVLV